ncbi:hypothetical protein CUMW_097570 [Citrus unshiu]|uniref:Uncharacterized protein n=1 Tax=Citrus unshiu TaxID=55188 RepID=A0A2H5P299_CITUN|nr:hypothetical protein CUMW_097570 [Citrus unshiu]
MRAAFGIPKPVALLVSMEMKIRIKAFLMRKILTSIYEIIVFRWVGHRRKSFQSTDLVSDIQKQISVFVEDEVETAEFPDEVGFIFSPRNASTCTSDEEVISANEKANALPEFSRTPGIKTFHKDGFHDFGSARLDGENTWSVVSKEAKALVHLNENALCSSSSQPTCKANKSGKDAQKSRSPKLIAINCKNVYIWKLDFTF